MGRQSYQATERWQVADHQVRTNADSIFLVYQQERRYLLVLRAIQCPAYAWHLGFDMQDDRCDEATYMWRRRVEQEE